MSHWCMSCTISAFVLCIYHLFTQRWINAGQRLRRSPSIDPTWPVSHVLQIAIGIVCDFRFEEQ